MPVRNVSAAAFSAVSESVNAAKVANRGDAVTLSPTAVSADTDELPVKDGTDCTVQLDFTISSHEIAYMTRNTADSGSAKETRTVRQHEYSHVGARNALASKSLLTALCNDVGVVWKFHSNISPTTDEERKALDAEKKKYEDAVEAYIKPIVDYLDELVVHETQRNAGLAGVSDATAVASMLAAISYTDPETKKTKKPSATVMAQAVTATKTGSANGEAHAKNTATPRAVKP
jgi:hypothetical protein